MNNLQDRLHTLIETKICEYEDGIRPLHADDLLKLYTALKPDTPTVDLVMALIHQQTAYLQDGFPCHADSDQDTIRRFLLAFTAHLSQDLLASSKTYKDGALLQQVLQGS